MPRRRARNNGNGRPAGHGLGVNVFGPQSPWSSLLGQREHLEHEIKRSRKYLGQLRKDLNASGILFQSWSTDALELGCSVLPDPDGLADANKAMEHFLLNWLEQLEERLGAVMKEIEDAETLPAPEPLYPEESMFELLRAAG